jgi:hypothetical protein
MPARYEDALAAMEMPEPWSFLQAAIYVRLGKLDDARITIDSFLKECPTCTIKEEAIWPRKQQPQFPVFARAQAERQVRRCRNRVRDRVREFVSP